MIKIIKGAENHSGLTHEELVPIWENFFGYCKFHMFALRVLAILDL